MNTKMGDICALYFILLQLTFTIDYFYILTYIPRSSSSRGDRMRNKPMLFFKKTNISWLGSPLQVNKSQSIFFMATGVQKPNKKSDPSSFDLYKSCWFWDDKTNLSWLGSPLQVNKSRSIFFFDIRLRKIDL